MSEYITQDKKKELLKELQLLESVRRKEILDDLDYAKSLGDLSENAEYHQARENQAKMEDRISEIKKLLRESVVVEKHHTSVVEVGSVVTVKKKGEKENRTYEVVGAEEADMSKNKISHKSPLGEAFMGKKKGDIVSFKIPSGPVEYTIVSIE